MNAAEAPGRSRVDELIAEGRSLEAIDRLTAKNRTDPRPNREVKLARLRHTAYTDLAGVVPTTPWPPGPTTPLVDEGIPEVAWSDCDVDTISRGVWGNGALIIRGLFPPEWNERLNADIDATMAAVREVLDEKAEPGAAREWFTPVEAPGHDLGGPGRFWVLNSGTVWTADSPRTLFDLIEAIDEVGLGAMLTELFGLRPVMSIMKSAMRRIPPDGKGAWHQDGYVAGPGTRALNVWIATSRCGDVSPGLDMYPTRLDHLVETSAPPPFDFGVSDELVAEMAKEHPIAQPVFEPGDAVVFDQFLLHQTGTGSNFTTDRYGFECWFFCPSTFPDRFVPLVF